MKKLSVLFFFCLAQNVFCQGVLESLFYKVPFMGYSLERKKEIISETKTNVPNGFLFDEKNGFMSYSGCQCDLEMCYWSYKSSNGGENVKLIAIVGCDCCTRPVFYGEVNGGPLVEFRLNQVLENFNALYFFKDKAKIGDIKPLLNDFIFQLPQKGLDIVVTFGGPYRTQDKYINSLLKGDKINFVWDGNGGFAMGEPYF